MRLLPMLMLVGLTVPALARDTDRVPLATPTGPAQSCIPINQIDQSLVRSDSVIDFRMRGGKVYRATLPGACPGLGFEQRFRYETSLSVLCSSDIITVFTTAPVMDGASCGLGPFQPVTLASSTHPRR